MTQRIAVYTGTPRPTKTTDAGVADQRTAIQEFLERNGWREDIIIYEGELTDAFVLPPGVENVVLAAPEQGELGDAILDAAIRLKAAGATVHFAKGR